MSKFETMTFYDDCRVTDFIAHAKKYDVEAVLQECVSQNAYLFESGRLRQPLVTDVCVRTVRFYPRIPDFCGLENDGGGCYSFCGAEERGSFKVWCIPFDRLLVDAAEKE